MVTVRAARPGDAAPVQQLLEQLGYSPSRELVEQRIVACERGIPDAALVAERDGKVVGVVSLHVLDLFHQPGRLGRITSLVVAEDQRAAGVGTALLAAADRHFRALGCLRVEVTSSGHRTAAHAFYEAHGYAPDARRFVKRYDPD